MQDSRGTTDPMDQLGTALMRATGLLSALSACQDPSRSAFALPEPFVMQAVNALEGFINEARNAYFDLCTVAASEGVVAPAGSGPNLAARHADTEHGAVEDAPGRNMETTLPDVFRLRRLETAASHEVRPPADDHGGAFVESYEALLRKLTAAEIFATERGFVEDDRGGPLLPLLQSLRRDIERLRAA